MTSQQDVSSLTVKKFIIWWNTTFPIDYWWRKKYKVSFNSEQHRSLNFIDAYIEHKEEKMIEEAMEGAKKRKEDLENYKVTGNFLNSTEEKLSQEEIDFAFENMDLANFNKKE